MVRFAAAAVSLLVMLAGFSSAFAQENGRPQRKPDVWYVPTQHELVKRMLDLAEVRPGDVVYDLGCGDGRIVIAAARDRHVRGVGVDIDPRRIRDARVNAERAGVQDMVTFRVADLFETDIREATVVMLYLLPEVNRKLKPKLFAELRPGARVVSHDFDMGPDWPPDKTEDYGVDRLFLWVMPPMDAR